MPEMAESMNPSQREMIESTALALMRGHFDLLNRRDLAAARRQLFFPPGMADKPLDVYVETMGRLAPFQILSLSVRRFDDLRQRHHGLVATVWIDVVVGCSLGERSATVAVWWFPESDEYRISERPSHWVLEKLRGDEPAS